MMNGSVEEAFAPLTSEMVAMIFSLNKFAVPYIVVGGFAVRVHGFLRPVEDLDLVIETTDESLARFSEALRDLHIKDCDNVVALFRRSGKARWRWRDGYIDHYLDILTKMDGQAFAALADDPVHVFLDSMQIPVLSRVKLIAAKRNLAVNPKRGRKVAQDLEDLEMLMPLSQETKVPVV